MIIAIVRGSTASFVRSSDVGGVAHLANWLIVRTNTVVGGYKLRLQRGTSSLSSQSSRTNILTTVLAAGILKNALDLQRCLASSR